MQIALEAIDFPKTSVRRQQAAVAIERMKASLSSDAGQVTPILVIANGNRFVCIDGGHRVAAAKALGWKEIWAEKAAHFAASYETLAGGVANAVRAPLEPLDEWRLMVTLQDDGRSLDAAAQALGITKRRAQQLDRLGRLDQSVIALIEDHNDMPAWHFLGQIASAPRDVQAKAARANDVVRRWTVRGVEHIEVEWYAIAKRCTKPGTRIPRSRAIFDTDKAGVVFEQDIFEQPGAMNEWTTLDVAGFMAAQKNAIEAEIEARTKKKQAAMLVDFNPSMRTMKAPRGFDLTHGDPAKPKKNEVVLICLQDDGHVMRETAIDAKAAREAAKARQKKAETEAKAKAPPAKPGPSPMPAEPTPAAKVAPEADDDEEAAVAPVADINPITKAGRDMIAKAKTKALRDALRAPLALPLATPFRDLCAMLVLALHAGNVDVRGYNAGYKRNAGDDLVAQIVNPAGQIDPPDDMTLARVARETLARFLYVGLPSRAGMSDNPDSGVIAEWIGNKLSASELLARFDTAEFLATVNATELRPVALANGIRPSKTAGDLRRQLTGLAPDWRPPGATFGAPGLQQPATPPVAREEAA